LGSSLIAISVSKILRFSLEGAAALVKNLQGNESTYCKTLQILCDIFPSGFANFLLGSLYLFRID